MNTHYNNQQIIQIPLNEMKKNLKIFYEEDSPENLKSSISLNKKYFNKFFNHNNEAWLDYKELVSGKFHNSIHVSINYDKSQKDPVILTIRNDYCPTSIKTIMEQFDLLAKRGSGLLEIRITQEKD